MTSEAFPRVLHDAGAAALLVDLGTSEVVYANLQAAAMAGQHPLPCPVDRWGQLAGLADPSGRDLADSSGPLSRVARGEPVSGELVQRVPDRASDEADVEHERQSRDRDRSGRAGVDRVEGPLWVTGFPLGGGNLADHALVVFMALDSTPTDLDAEGVRRSRAVVATDLSFSISDPTSPDDPLVWVNPAFERDTGYTLAEVAGRNCRFLQGPGTDRAEVARIREALEAGEPVVSTLLNYRKDGTPFWNQVSISPVHDADGRLVNFVGVQVDVTAKIEAEEGRSRARARLGLLAEVGEAVSGLDVTDSLQRLTELLAAYTDGPCAVTVLEEHLELVAAAGTGAPDLDGRAVRLPRGEAGDDPVLALLRGARRAPYELGRVEESGIVSAWTGRLLGGRPALAVPMAGRRGVLGVVLLRGDLAPDDLAIAREAIARAGLGVDNARLYQREHELTMALQRSMLPGPISLPDLDVWTHYVPSSEHAQVGGDWYDVITRPDGSYAVVIGDVVGHDVEAAAVMGQLRSTVRAYAYELDDPALVLDRVDELARGMHLSRMASIAYLALRPDGRGCWTARWATAGHLPPLHRSGSGEVRRLTNPRGGLIGMLSQSRGTDSAVLEPGDVVVLFTDGLIERRGRSLPDSLRTVEERLAAADERSSELLGRDLVESLGEPSDDDTALVVLRVPLPGETTDVTGARADLTADRHAPAAARKLVAGFLRERGARSTLAAELVTSELVSNALVHGSGRIGVTVGLVGEDVRIEVSDGEPGGPTISRPGLEGGGHGLRLVDELSRWGHAVTADGKRVWAILHPDAEHRIRRPRAGAGL